MEWLSYLLVLLCPLMMIFCMKGMTGHKHSRSVHQDAKEIAYLKDEQEMHELQQRLEYLIEQNEDLKSEIRHLRTDKIKSS